MGSCRLIVQFCNAVVALVDASFAVSGDQIVRAADILIASTYVGSATCAACHPDEAKLWSGSHHKAAMDHATDASELGT